MAPELVAYPCKSEQQCSVTAPHVPVVVCAYNGENFLPPAIENILNHRPGSALASSTECFIPFPTLASPLPI